MARPVSDVPRLFATMWAVAVLFHVLSGPMRFQAVPPTGLGLVLLALGLTAVAVLARPRDLRLLIVLAALQVLSVWFEAPMLGNHWLIAGFVDLALLAAAGAVWWRRRSLDVGAVFAWFTPTARWVLLISYGFAAFAKLNRAFLDPAVSCATFFARESLGVFGLDHLVSGGGVTQAVIWGTIAVELAIPVLLAVRRTRTAGVVLAFGFHAVLALDLAHPFFDFSSLLLALFFLFLPPGFAAWVGERVPASGRAGGLAEAGAQVLLVVVAGLLLMALGPPTPTLAVPTLAGAYLLWFVYAAVCVVAVTSYAVAHRPVGQNGALTLPGRATIVVLALVVLNGLTPYLEVKTAFGFNMYSNLVTVDGASNHLLVPRTLPLTDVHEDLVAIRSSSDPDLRWYADNDYALPWLTFRAYVEDHPEAAVSYLRDGAVDELAPGASRVEPVPAWREKLMAFRTVDLQDPKRCQDVWGPAS